MPAWVVERSPCFPVEEFPANMSDSVHPDAPQPDAVQPDAPQPDAVHPDAVQPDAPQPETGRSDAGHQPRGSGPDSSPRGRILKAAREVFAGLAFERVRVEDILRRARVARPTFYRLFANKQEVYAEVAGDQAPLERSALERVREGAREAFGQLGYRNTRVDDLVEASGVARSTFYRVFRNKQDAFEQLDRVAVEYLRRAIRFAVAHPARAQQRLRFAAESYLEWRKKVGESSVQLGQATPAPRHPVAEWRTPPSLDRALPYPAPDAEPDVDGGPTDVSDAAAVTGDMEPALIEAAVMATEALARLGLDSDRSETHADRIGQVLTLLMRLTRRDAKPT